MLRVWLTYTVSQDGGLLPEQISLTVSEFPSSTKRLRFVKHVKRRRNKMWHFTGKKKWKNYPVKSWRYRQSIVNKREQVKFYWDGRKWNIHQPNGSRKRTQKGLILVYGVKTLAPSSHSSPGSKASHPPQFHCIKLNHPTYQNGSPPTQRL